MVSESELVNRHRRPSDPLRARQESGDEAHQSNEAAVEAALAGLSVPPHDRTWPARVRLAVTLARTLDVGAGMSTGAVSRELRLTLASLTPEVGTDDDTRALLDALSDPTVRDTAEPPAGDVRAGDGRGRRAAGDAADTAHQHVADVALETQPDGSLAYREVC